MFLFSICFVSIDSELGCDAVYSGVKKSVTHQNELNLILAKNSLTCCECQHEFDCKCNGTRCVCGGYLVRPLPDVAVCANMFSIQCAFCKLKQSVSIFSHPLPGECLHSIVSIVVAAVDVVGELLI